MNKALMVSVAIPTYNQEKYIAQTVASVLSQKTNFDFEIVVGEDCSQDRTRAILEDLQSRYPEKLKVLAHEKNLGVVLNTKQIFDNCRGKYIALLGGDDSFCDEHKLQKQFEFLESRPDYGAVHSDARILLDNGQEVTEVIGSADRCLKRKVKSGEIFCDLLLSNFIIASTFFFRRDLYCRFIDFELYHSLGFKGESRPLMLELSYRSKIGYVPESMTAYRQVQGTISRPVSKEKKFALYEAANSTTQFFLDKYGAPQDVKDKLAFNFNMFNLIYGFECGQPKRAIESYSYFKKTGRASGIVRLYYYGTRSKCIGFILKVFRKGISSLRLNFYNYV